MSCRTGTFAGICFAAIAIHSSRPAEAISFSDPGFLGSAPAIETVGKDRKDLHVGFDLQPQPWRREEVLLIVRQVEDPVRKARYGLQVVGRAAVVDAGASGARLVFYKPFKGAEARPGDRLLRTGDPLTADEMDLVKKEVLGVLKRDKELEDLYTGLISVKVGMYSAQLDSESSNDTNSFKRAPAYFLKTFGLRWWSQFMPTVGLNFEYATGDIATTGFHREPESSSQTYLNPGLMYRGRFLVVPTLYSLTYFINSFQTSNPDDFLISSTYSGINLSLTFYYPYKLSLLRLGPFSVSVQDIEGTFGFAPMVNVSDSNYSRGSEVSANQVTLGAGVELNLGVNGWRFTDNLFFVFEGGMQRYGLSFKGPTSGTIPFSGPLPENGTYSELQTWYGVRIKYNFPDVIGDLINGN